MTNNPPHPDAAPSPSKLVEQLRNAAGRPANIWQQYVSLVRAEEIANTHETAQQEKLRRVRDDIQRCINSHDAGFPNAVSARRALALINDMLEG